MDSKRYHFGAIACLLAAVVLALLDTHWFGRAGQAQAAGGGQEQQAWSPLPDDFCDTKNCFLPVLNDDGTVEPSYPKDKCFCVDSRSIANLNLYKLQAKAVKLTNLQVAGQVNLNELRATELRIEVASFGDVFAEKIDVGRLVLRGVKVSPGILNLRHAKVGPFHETPVADLDSIDVPNGLVLEGTTIQGKLELIRIHTQEVRLQSSEQWATRMPEMAIWGSEIGILDLGSDERDLGAVARLETAASKIGRLYLPPKVADLRWSSDTTLELVHTPSKGLEGVVRSLNLQRQWGEDVRPHFLSLEKSLRDGGDPRTANLVNLAQEPYGGGDRWTAQVELVAGWPAYILLRGRGNPLYYLFLLLTFVSLGAATIFTNRNNVGAAGSSDYYSPWLMSLVTLLPGDYFGYLRTFKCEPKGQRARLWLTALQMLALLVQGLLVYSILSLLA